MSVIAFLQRRRSACMVCEPRHRAVMWHFKQYFSGPAEPAVRGRLLMASHFTSGHEGALQTYSHVACFVLKWYATDGNIATLDNDLQVRRLRNLTATVFDQYQWSEILTGRSFHDEEGFNSLIADRIRSSIVKALAHSWADHQVAPGILVEIRLVIVST